MGNIVMSLFTAVAMSVAAASPLAAEPTPAAATEAEFTPLDEIERVRQEGCGIDQFEDFLGWYVSSTTSGGWLEQVIWTNYMVKVGRLADPEGAANWVDRQDYVGQFRITSADYRFSREKAITGTGIDFRRVTLKRLGEKQYRVDWHGGLGFAGVDRADQDKQDGAYIFEFKKDCWYLTEDLR